MAGRGVALVNTFGKDQGAITVLEGSRVAQLKQSTSVAAFVTGRTVPRGGGQVPQHEVAVLAIIHQTGLIVVESPLRGDGGDGNRLPVIVRVCHITAGVLDAFLPRLQRRLAVISTGRLQYCLRIHGVGIKDGDGI